MRRLIVFTLLAVAWPLAAVAYPEDLFSSPLPRPAPQKLRSLAQNFRQAPVLVLHFRQVKHLPELKQPLVSKGVLLIVPSLGVDWRVTQPFPSEWQVTRAGRVLKGPDNGAPQAVADLLIGLFSADTRQLRSTFKLYWSKQESAWWLGLKPGNPRLGKVIKTIAVSGNPEVRRIEIHETGGDRTVIEITGRKKHALTQAVRQRFSS